MQIEGLEHDRLVWDLCYCLSACISSGVTAELGLARLPRTKISTSRLCFSPTYLVFVPTTTGES